MVCLKKKDTNAFKDVKAIIEINDRKMKLNKKTMSYTFVEKRKEIALNF